MMSYSPGLARVPSRRTWVMTHDSRLETRASPGIYEHILPVHHEPAPSTFSVWPQMLRASGDARNAAIAAMSLASCQRPSGTTFRIFSSVQAS